MADTLTICIALNKNFRVYYFTRDDLSIDYCLSAYSKIYDYFLLIVYH